VIVSYFVKSFFIIIIDMKGGAPRCSLKVDLMTRWDEISYWLFVGPLAFLLIWLIGLVNVSLLLDFWSLSMENFTVSLVVLAMEVLSELLIYASLMLRFCGVIQVIRCLLYVGDKEDVDHLFFNCPFSHCIWIDLGSKCLIPFCRCSWVNIISWLSNLRGGWSLHSVLMRLMLATAVYYI
jgi:hypothetical protein